MLLEKLREYSTRIDETPVMYKKTPIRWVINLDGQGNFLGMVQTSSEGSGKKKDKGKEYLAPTIGKSVNIAAKLFSENEVYTLGADKDGKDREWSIKRHEFYKALIARCAEETACPSVIVVKRFYDAFKPEDMELPDGFKPGDLFTFNVDGSFPMDDPSVRGFWAKETTGRGDGRDDVKGTCLICGNEKTVVDRLPLKVNGIPGGQTSGTSLVSANAVAFESYGLEASYISPICHECGEAFGKALNDLIASESTHITIGNMVYVFWTREETGFDAVSLFQDPQPEDVKKLLAKPLTGERASSQDDTLFYCAAFSASGGRAVVRDWLVTTLGEVQRNLARYFRAQSLVELDGTEGAPLPVWKMTSSLTFKKETVAPNVPKSILRFAFNGGVLPMSLIFQAVKRNRAEQSLTRPRAVLIKMVLMSRKEYTNKEDSMEKVDLTNDNPAYLCGRLFGVLEEIQRLAINPKATITSRFYGTASTAPASVFGRLMKGSQNHIGKLRDEKPGACKYLEDDLIEVTGRLKTFPVILNLEEQGLFALGFYHQKAHRKAAVEERKAKRAEEAGE